MHRTWTEAEERWLVENYPLGTINDNLDAFEREFGRRPSKSGFFQKAHDMGLRKRTQTEERSNKAQKTMRWSSPEFERERNWMLENDKSESVLVTIEAFEREFGIRLNRSQVSLFRATYGTSRRVSHGGGRPSRPVGSERVGKDGYLMVKVREWPDVPQSKDNWRFKHHIVYEENHGPIPEGHIVLFADRDTRNFDPDNLVAIPRKLIGVLNQGYKWTDAATLKAAISCAMLDVAIVDAKNAPRPCALCGAVFTPPYRSNQKRNTCPDCVKKGRKLCVMHGRAGEAKCDVCGKTFARNKKNQRRCRECIAEKPSWSVDAHARSRWSER